MTMIDPKVTVVASGRFGGGRGRYQFPLPEGCDAVMLCWNTGTGLQGTYVSLAHQIYVERVEELIAEHPDIKWITVIPIRSSEYITIWDKSKPQAPTKTE